MAVPQSLLRRLRLAGLLAWAAGLPVLIVLALAAVVALLLGLALAGAGPLALVLAVGPLAGVLIWLRALLRSFRAVAVRPVAPEAAPALHEALEAARLRLKGPRAASVQVVRGFGLDLHVSPVLGVLGWARCTWLLGLFPLMALSPREFESLLTWEMAYWSDQHGWMNLQAKRLAEVWHRVDSEPPPGEFSGAVAVARSLLRRFARATMARFQPFLRESILHSDEVAAEAHGAATHARALLRMALVRAMLDRGLLRGWDRRLAEGEPMPEDPLSEAAAFLARWPMDLAESLMGLLGEGALRGGPVLLGARLANLGQRPEAPVPPGRTAAAALDLEGSAPWEDARRMWRDELQAMAEKRGRERVGKDARWEVLRGKDPVDPDEALEYLQLASDRLPPEEVLPRLEAHLAAHPDQELPLLLRARLRLRAGDAEGGRADLRRLEALDPFNGALVHRLMADHLERGGDVEGAWKELDEADRRQRLLDAAQAERARFTLGDPMLPHGLGPGELEAIRAYLAGLPRVRRAFLVRKAVTLFPERPVLLLGIVPREPFLFGKKAFTRRLQREVARGCPMPAKAKAFVLVFGHHLRNRHRRLARVPGSEIHRRRWWR